MTAGNAAGFFQSDRFRRWLDRRIPPTHSTTLDQKKIFILPTREGYYFAILVIFMVLAGINYQNSLVYALSFLLSSLFMVSMLHTFRNLSGLTIQAGGGTPAFAGEDAAFGVILSRQGERTFEAVTIGWDPELMQGADLLEDTEVELKLFAPTSQRGRFNPGRVLIETRYPVGLFRAWSWIDLDVSTVVYPRPLPGGAIPPAASNTGEGELLQHEGVDDFHGFRDYQHGDPLRHVAWKSYARSDELLTKQYAAFVDRRVWLDWAMFGGMDREARLSRLCDWVLKLERTTDAYGLRLPGLEIEPSRGESHRDQVLTALALFEAPA